MKDDARGHKSSVMKKVGQKAKNRPERV